MCVCQRLLLLSGHVDLQILERFFVGFFNISGEAFLNSIVQPALQGFLADYEVDTSWNASASNPPATSVASLPALFERLGWLSQYRYYSECLWEPSLRWLQGELDLDWARALFVALGAEESPPDVTRSGFCEILRGR